VRRTRRRRAGPDALTVGLGALAAGTAGTVIAAEYLRRLRRRIAGASPAETPLGTAEQALGAATVAAQDTVTVALEGYSETPRGETVLFNILNGFAGSIALMRLSTWGIRSGWWPLGNVRVRGSHIHHFVPGILLAFVAGGAGLITQNKALESALAFPFGAGIGMTFDEAALLLRLDDVYWSREGILSVQLSLGLAGILGATIIGLRMLRRGERGAEDAGLIPAESGEYLVVFAT
jgi:hypothetical protein